MTDGSVNTTLAYRHIHHWVCADCGDEKVVARPRLTIGPPGLRGPSPAVHAQREAWRDVYLSDPNATIKSIAEQFGVKLSTVYSGLRALKTPMRTSRRGDTDRVEVIRRPLIDERLTLEEVGQRLGISRERVRQISKRHIGISTRALRTAETAAKRAQWPHCRICDEEYPKGHAARAAHYRAVHPNAKVTPEAREKYLAVVADYDAGMKNDEIMAKYACSASLIYRALKYLGRTHDRVQTGRAGTLAESYARHDAIAADLASTGLTNLAIAEKYGVSDSLVHQINQKRHIRTRRPR